MKATSVSTAALSQSLRFSLLRMQSDLQKAQKEASTLQVADTGIALGARSTQAVSLDRDLQRMEGIIDSNGLVSARLQATQDSLSKLAESAQSFLSTLTTNASGSQSLTDVTKASARTMLDTLSSVLNTSFNGEYLFAGINTDVRPVTDYRAAGSPAKTAFDAAFTAHFGFPQTDPAAATITKPQMEAFLTTVEPEFLGAGWSANWSSATDEPIVTRITLTDTSESSVSANEPGMRKLAMAATLVYDLFNGEVSAGGLEAVMTKAISLVGEAVGSIASLQGTTGVIEKRISDASDRLGVQVDLFTKQLGNLISVDPYEAQTRVSNLLTQIETSYALTARIQQISLLRFIS